MNKLPPKEAATASQVDFDFGQYHNRASHVENKITEGAALDILDEDCFSIPRADAQKRAQLLEPTDFAKTRVRKAM